MRKSILHSILFTLLPFALLAQEVQIQRQVIGAGGKSQQANTVLISSTVGEAIVGGENQDQFTINQGFQQSSSTDTVSISYDYAVKEETCPDTEDGEIILSNFEGCENGFYSVLWEDGEEGMTRNNLSSGWYGFTLSACGALKKDSVFVGTIYENSCQLIFYTAFSPNGDGVNDTWEIDNINTEPNDVNTVLIFDLWGNKVEDFVNYNNSSVVWNGKDEKGKELTEGTYYYQVDVNGQIFTGYTELTR